jgi:8-oxo-dGTP diphosphatase
MIHIAGGVIYNPNLGVVVVNQNNNSWSLPKGHVERGEEPKDAAVREIWEETGIPVEKLNFLAPLGFYERMRIKLNRDDPDELRTITIYLFSTDNEKLNPHDSANPEARWVNIHDVSALLTHPKDKEFFEKSIPLIEKYAARATTAKQ